MRKVSTIGISGPSCAGKTTLARILKRIVAHSIVIYQDDFYKPEDQLPIDPETKLANWDCPDAIDFERLGACIEYIVLHGTLPPGLSSKEINNKHDGSATISDHALIPHITDCDADDILYLIVDGFMLYWDPRVYEQLDIKFFCQASYETLKDRRNARQGYVTNEGYWIDPPGYFDTVVWPQYLKWKAHLGETRNDVVHLDTDKLSITAMTDVAMLTLKKNMCHSP